MIKVVFLIRPLDQFPALILFSAMVNLTGWLLDQIDYPQPFYSNVLLVARKPPE